MFFSKREFSRHNAGCAAVDCGKGGSHMARSSSRGGPGCSGCDHMAQSSPPQIRGTARAMQAMQMIYGFI
jgi:hypothetical protein